MDQHKKHYDIAKHPSWCAAALLDIRIRALFSLPYGMHVFYMPFCQFIMLHVQNMYIAPVPIDSTHTSISTVPIGSTHTSISTVPIGSTHSSISTVPINSTNTVNSQSVQDVAQFAVDSLSLHCHNGQIEKFWRQDRAYSSHFRQGLGPLTKERVSIYKWNKAAIAKLGYC